MGKVREPMHGATAELMEGATNDEVLKPTPAAAMVSAGIAEELGCAGFKDGGTDATVDTSCDKELCGAAAGAAREATGLTDAADATGVNDPAAAALGAMGVYDPCCTRGGIGVKDPMFGATGVNDP